MILSDIAGAVMVIVGASLAWWLMIIQFSAARRGTVSAMPEEVMSAAWREVNEWEVASGLEPTPRPRPLGSRDRLESVDISWL